MRGQICLLILASTVFIVSTADDKFIFNVTLDCGQPSFTYNLQFFEQDFWLFNGDDKITKQQLIGDGNRSARFIEEGSQDGDERWSSGYDVVMKLYHDCNEYKKDFELTLYIIPQCAIGKGLCRYVIHKDIKDAKGHMNYHAKLTYE